MDTDFFNLLHQLTIASSDVNASQLVDILLKKYIFAWHDEL
jgi:hypothetical protein